MDGSKSAPLAKAWIQLAPTLEGSQRAIEKQLGGVGAPAGRTAGKGFGKGFSLGLGPIAAAGGAILAGGFAVDFAQGAIDEASNLGESVNALDVVFKKNSDSIKAMGEDAAATLGLSNVEFNGLAVQFGGFAKAVGGKGKGVVKFLDNVTTRAADFASVMNLDVAEAAQLFQSGLAGETEPLRRFGIDLSAAAVEAFAYSTGLAKSGEQLTESEKVQARYGLLMKETNQTAGDFANTSDSLANSQRILNAEWANSKAQLGEKLLPVMQEVTGWLVDHGIPAVETFIDDLSDPNSTIGGFVESAKDLWTTIDGPLAATGSELVELGGLAMDNMNALLSGDSDAISAAAEATEAWAATGDGIVADAVNAMSLVSNSFAEGTVWEDWLEGSGINDALFKQDPTTADATSGALAVESAFKSMSIDWSKAIWDPILNAGAITADANASFGSQPQTVNVYVDTVVTQNSQDLVAFANQEARRNSPSGSRGSTKSGRPTNRGQG